MTKILKNFNLFVDGRGYAGRAEEVTPPKLTIKTEELRAGGMDAPISIDLGMEKLECGFSLVEYDPNLMQLTEWAFRVMSISYLVFGFSVLGSSFFTALGNGTISALIETFRLFIFQVLFLFTLPKIFGTEGIFYAFVAAEAAGCLVSIAFLAGMRKKYGY